MLGDGRSEAEGRCPPVYFGAKRQSLSGLFDGELSQTIEERGGLIATSI